MSTDFIKPTKVVVKPSEVLMKALEKGLEKDLAENEILCSVCGGTGLMVENNRYGLSEDPDRSPGKFPYKHQTITSCNNCYSGVIKLCQYCKKEMPRHCLKCDCEEVVRLDREKQEIKDKKVFDKAIKVTSHDPIVDNILMLYSEHYSNNDGYFIEWGDFIEDWENNHDPDDKKPTHVWSTDIIPLKLDAHDIIESATQDMHESAFDDIGRDNIKELQNLLNKWIDENAKNVKSYMVNYMYAIEIPWSE